jgi:hypothetical protein
MGGQLAPTEKNSMRIQRHIEGEDCASLGKVGIGEDSGVLGEGRDSTESPHAATPDAEH